MQPNNPMGAEPYSYFVPYQPDINAALQQLREREFHAGRYNPANEFPADEGDEATGAQHASIDEAREEAAEDGTRSILDLDHVSQTPEDFAVSPLDEKILRELYGTDKPTQAMVEENEDFFEELYRGQGIYIVTYRNNQPDQIYFGGLSFD